MTGRLSLRCLAAILAFTSAGVSLPIVAQRATVAERVGGTVLNAKDGQSVPRAVLTLEDVHSDKTVATTHAREDGTFQFETVPPGRYRMYARARGFVPNLYLGHNSYSAAIVTGAGLPTGSLRMQLTPEASIFGHIMDENGEPLRALSQRTMPPVLTLYCQDLTSTTAPVQECRRAAVEPDGSFEFPELKPGTYFLAATARPWYEVHPPMGSENARLPYAAAVDPKLDVAYPMMFYPHALSSDQAEALVLKAGDQVTADLQMVPEKALSIAIPEPASSPWTFPQIYRNVFGAEDPVSPMMDAVDNVAYLTGLPQGQYILEDTQRGNGLPLHSREVTLNGRSVTLDSPTPATTFPVSLRVRGVNGTPLNQGSIVLLSGSHSNTASTPADAQGRVEFGKVPPGDYSLTVGQGQTVLRLLVNAKPVESKHLHVEDEAITGEVTFGSGVTVTGTVRSGGKPLAGAMVVLVPADATPAADTFRRDESDLDGGFSLPEVAPGRYLLIALEDGWSLPWTDAHALERYLLHAQPVVVSPANGKELPLKSAVPAQPAL